MMLDGVQVIDRLTKPCRTAGTIAQTERWTAVPAAHGVWDMKKDAPLECSRADES